MVVCEPGVYSLRTGMGPIAVDPDCGSSHCELLTQDNLATLIVVRVNHASSMDWSYETLFD